MRLRSSAKRKGFTLIELSFAIAFISVLLITVTLITNEIVSIYRKGYAIKAINQSGRDLIDDIQNSITESPPASIVSFCERYTDDTLKERCKNHNGLYSVYQQFYSDVKINGGTAKKVPTGGIFCSGKYTYIWNSGYLFNNNFYAFNDSRVTPLTVDYTRADGSRASAPSGFRLIKVEDVSRLICMTTLQDASGSLTYPSTTTPLVAPGSNSEVNRRTITIPYPLADDPEEMLTTSDTSLALFDFVIFEPARVASSDRLLFSGSFILATVSGGVDIMSSSNYCQAPSTFSADFSYCAINKFNFTIQASGN